MPQRPRPTGAGRARAAPGPAAPRKKRPRVTREGDSRAPATPPVRSGKSFAGRVKARRGAATASVTPATLTPTPTPAPSSSAPPRPRPQRDPDPGFVAVGRVLAPFGVKGELKVQSLTDNPARFRARSRIWAGQQLVTIVEAREAQGYVYLRLKGFHDRTSIERFRHAILQIPEADLPALPEGEHYRFQLVGLTVVDRDGAGIGTLDEVIETGANDVYRVRRADGTDLLLAAVADVVLEIDVEAGRMVVDPPEWR